MVPFSIIFVGEFCVTIYTGRCSMDHNHRNDGYGTEHLYVAIVQILSTDSVKPSAATTGLFNRLA